MSFATLKNPTAAAEILQRSLQRGRLAHAYLFTGTDLDDLEDLASALIQTLHCESPISDPENSTRTDACTQCHACRRVSHTQHPDVLWLRPESKSRVITIDQIREIVHAVNLKPTEGQWKVAVVVGADRMNPQAANAFLKTLEEPPPRSVLILLSTQPESLLDTILSRCLRLTLGPGGTTSRFQSEQSWITDFSTAAADCESGLIGRYRLLDNLLTRLTQIRQDVESDKSEASPLAQYDDLDPVLRRRWEDELKAGIEAEYRHRRATALAALHWWLRDVWLNLMEAPDTLLNFPEFQSQTQSVARRLTPQQALSNIGILEQTQQLLDSNVQEALTLEVGLLKLSL